MKPPFPIGTIDQFTPNTPNFFLSNFYPCPVRYEKIMYPTVEHAYQAAKTEDQAVRLLIYAQPTPARAKLQGKNVRLRKGWDEIKFGIMQELLEQKFSRGSVLANRLIKTDDVLLIEGNWWHDLVWGQCFCPRHNWIGSNRLGGILMDIRTTLQKASPCLQE